MLQRYHAMMETTGHVIFTVDHDGRFLECSPSVEKLLGYSRDEVVGTSFIRYIDPDWRERVAAFYRRQRDEGIRETLTEFPIVTASGEQKWVEQTVIATIDPANSQSGLTYQAISRDVTERKQAEQSLQESEERYRTLFEATFEAVILHRKGRIIDVNQAFETMLGYSREEAIGMTMFDLAPPETHQWLTEKIRSGSQRPFETVALRKDGTTFLADLHAKTIQYKGKEVRVVTVRDITERRQTQKDLEESRALYRAIVEDQTELICRFLPDGTYTFVNEAYCRYFGKLRRDFIGSNLSTVIPQNGREPIWSVLSSLSRDNPVGVFEENLLTRDGEPTWRQWTLRMIFDDQDRFIEYQAVGRDVTESRKIQQALAESERRYRSVVDSLKECVFQTDADGHLTFLNPAWTEITGYSVEESLGQHFLNFVHPENKIRIQELVQPLLDRAVDELRYESSFLTRAGHVRWLDVFVRVTLDADGRLTGAAGTLNDITERKKVEEERNHRIQQLVALSHFDALLANKLDVHYVLEMAMEALLGMSKADCGFIGLMEEGRLRLVKTAGDYSQAVIDTAHNWEDSIVGRVLRQREALLVEDLPDRSDILISLPGMRAKIAIPLISQERVIGVVNLESAVPERFTRDSFDFLRLLTTRIAVALDNAQLYERTEAQLAELQQLYDRVSRLEQIKTEMIRLASHDLRTPLGTIIGYLEMLRLDFAGHGTEVTQEYLDSIEKAARRIQRIVNDILSLERIQEAADTPCQVVDLCQTAERSVYEHADDARLKSQTLDFEKPDSRLIVSGDAIQLAQAMDNLIGNALKYTPEGGHILVRLRPDNGEVCFEVEDDGCGVPEAQQSRLFQPFFRARNRQTPAVEGTGLGLYLVKTIVERHGGRLIFHSVYGKGSTFGFALPLRCEG